MLKRAGGLARFLHGYRLAGHDRKIQLDLASGVCDTIDTENRNEENKMWLAIVVIFIIIAEPLAVIWAINTLFATGIKFTFWNWLATFVLSVILIGPSRAK